MEVFTGRSKAFFFCGSFLLFVFRVVILSCLFVAALWSPAGGGGVAGWPLGFLECFFFLRFCRFPHVVSWVGCGT